MPAYKDKNNKWYVSFRYQDWTGKKVRKVKRGFETRREALEWERRFLLKENGSMDMPFGNFVEIYKEDLKERLKRSTWIMKISVIDQKILPYFKDKKINEIKASDVIAWQKEIMGYIKALYWAEEDTRLFPITKSYLHREMTRGCDASGVKRIRIHDLRHSHVSLLINMGFSAVAIADRVGHESIDITYRYAHLFPSTQKEIAKKLNLERN